MVGRKGRREGGRKGKGLKSGSGMGKEDIQGAP
jgi:hypothetical protein